MVDYTVCELYCGREAPYELPDVIANVVEVAANAKDKLIIPCGFIFDINLMQLVDAQFEIFDTRVATTCSINALLRPAIYKGK